MFNLQKTFLLQSQGELVFQIRGLRNHYSTHTSASSCRVRRIIAMTSAQKLPVIFGGLQTPPVERARASQNLFVCHQDMMHDDVTRSPNNKVRKLNIPAAGM